MAAQKGKDLLVKNKYFGVNVYNHRRIAIYFDFYKR